ncbi:serine hydrolase [Paenibacillus soyae]|uniref:Serine hydrolase n=1 Tax=Paenibacillus soyae TaxID=2969249 RepID=A0A9X2S6I6_9BACL|nr:serine hydrolase [Paenibacillus soyae]MCR2802279.1 serine hydrolase [Paenibacillus soyae]
MKPLFVLTAPRWAKTITAAVLSLALLTPAIQASAATTADAAKGKTLDAASATAFLDGFFGSEEAKAQYVGASAVVVKDGQVLAQKGYGYADKENEVAVDPESTVFRIASVSKTFAAAAAMQLVEQGKIGLQDDFTKYIKDLDFDNPFDKPVTIEHLLTHTTGFEIRDPKPEDLSPDFERVVEIDDYVRENMPPVVREPGSVYMYDNFASMLLGLVVQNASGQPYEEYMADHIFEPLGMENSDFLLTGKLKDKLAVEYTAAHEKMEPYAVAPTVMPQGGMLSTAEDIGKFMIAFLNGGAAGSNRILSEQTVASMEEYRSEIHPLLPDTTYGFEAPFQLPGAGSSSKIITKGGDLLGTSSYMFLIPEQNTGVFVTYNQQGILRNGLYAQFISTFFPQYAAPVAMEAFEAKEDELAKFVGHYSDLRIDMIVSSIGTEGEGDLVISDSYIGPRALKQVDDNLFVDSMTNQFTGFKLDDEGNVLYMKEPYLNPMGYAKKGEQAQGFADVGEDHPYASYIYALQSLGYLENNGDADFNPDQTVTRGEYVQNLLSLLNMTGVESAQPAFADLEGHSAAPYIQLAHTIGMVKGNGKGNFYPDKPITRQEAAVMIYRLIAAQYPAEAYSDIALAGETDEWAVEAVQMMIALQLFGPEIQPEADGSVDYRSKEALTRAEEAAILYTSLTTPTDIIYASLAQNAEGGAEASEEAAEPAAEPAAELPNAS